jgi:hypothetical protein
VIIAKSKYFYIFATCTFRLQYNILLQGSVITTARPPVQFPLGLENYSKGEFCQEINNSIYQRPVTHKSTNHHQKDSPLSVNYQIIINNAIHQGTIINKLIN